ncbi:MAG: permease-like cell division protein FtsX [Oscillospiraceae bacterium]|nr:permease-like cell division protein FtsX [Oscillospiraceae bacterium]
MSRKQPRRRNNLGYYLREGTSSIFTHGFMSFASVVIIVACLVIMGSFLLVAFNINDMMEEAESRNQIMAFVDEELTEEEARDIERHILTISNVEGATFISREQAWASWIYDDPERFAGLDETTLRHRFIVDLEDIAGMEMTLNRLEQVPGIAEVRADTEIAGWFVTARNVIATVFIVIIAVLLAISIFIISNTIKLATFDRREEIAIMRMVGATNWFIRWPFIFQGFILGLVGAAVAFFLQWGLYGVLTDQILVLSGGELIQVASFGEVAEYMMLLFLGTGFVVGILGSALAIRNYLKV